MTNDPTPDLPKLSAPARRALTRAGFSTLEQLTQAKESDLARLHGMGPKAIDSLRDSLRERGLSFKTSSGPSHDKPHSRMDDPARVDL